ncbi:hypothetical protein RRG08_043275 [Elysia crispata]|uniref:Uncharacterized protein n=1 Tax=Elysia crispata TaxID=231223 RepID=A0AAE1CNV5_9GAST|nr:hypothetical protein RRG08_043275 [Elysia crispata]
MADLRASVRYGSYTPNKPEEYTESWSGFGHRMKLPCGAIRLGLVGIESNKPRLSCNDAIATAASSCLENYEGRRSLGVVSVSLWTTIMAHGKRFSETNGRLISFPEVSYPDIATFSEAHNSRTIGIRTQFLPHNQVGDLT